MRSILALVIACLLAGSVAAGAATPPPADSIAARVDRYLTARMELGQFSGAVLVARGGDTLLRKGYGYADIDRRIRFTPETPQEIASVSKMFTAMAVLGLRDRGRLALTDSLARWLPDCPPAWRSITLEQLLRHTSGIPDYEEALGIGSPAYMKFMASRDASARIVSEARVKPLDFEPGTKFQYSNTGYVMLGQVVERAAGQPFADFVTHELLAPAGMARAGVFDGGAGPAGLARGYTYGDLGWERMLAGSPLTDGHLEAVPHLPLAPPAGDGGMYGTVDDLLRWSRVMDGATEVFTPGLGGYGYGWFIDDVQGHRRFRHNGILPGHLTLLIKFPDDSLTVALVSNVDRLRLERAERDLGAIALGMAWDLPVRGKVVTLSAEQFTALEGTFLMPGGKKLTVHKDPDMLAAALEGRYTAGLIPLSPTEFYFPLGDGRALFTLGADGRATRVNMRYGGEDHVAERAAP